MEEADKTSKATRALVPELRFPEFTDPWEEKEMKPYLEEHFERVPADTDLPIFSSTRKGLKLQKDYYDGRELINYGEYRVVPDGLFVYRHMSDDGTFKFNINHTGQKIAVSKEYPVFTTVELYPDFLLYKINDGVDFKRFALMQKKGGTRTRLYFNILCLWKTLLPSFPEQQKIADCLSSVDELITLEIRKIDALKAHKKGLMQQLFPAEGETLPKLRFPEFRDAGEWGKNKLGEICYMRAGKFVSAGEISEKNGYALYPCYGGNGLRGYVKKHTHSGKYPLIGRQGALCGNVILGEGEFHATEHAVVAAPFSGINIDWLFYDLLKLNLNRFATGQAQPGLSVDVLEKVECLVPRLEAEQQKIADCLSSIDNLIALQSQKLDALKAHKKGLMQRLFPSSGEVRK